MSDEVEGEFERCRARLFRLAYRMVGTTTDAEDLVQDAYLRLLRSEADVASVEAWLVTAVTRLSIDRLRTLTRDRERYIGPWLPEPALDEVSPDDFVERGADISFAFLVALERLTPEERAAFLMREVYVHDYAEIALMLQKSEAACRQLVHRSRQALHGPARFQVGPASRGEVLNLLVRAMERGDEPALLRLLAPQAVMFSDGGGRITAARKPLHGASLIARLIAWRSRNSWNGVSFERRQFNGAEGILVLRGGALVAAVTFEMDNDRVVRIYQVGNPEKLQALQGALAVHHPERSREIGVPSKQRRTPRAATNPSTMTVIDRLRSAGTPEAEAQRAASAIDSLLPVDRAVLITDEVLDAARAGDVALVVMLLAEEVELEPEELAALEAAHREDDEARKNRVLALESSGGRDHAGA